MKTHNLGCEKICHTCSAKINYKTELAAIYQLNLAAPPYIPNKMLPHVICYSRGDKVPEGYKIINTTSHSKEQWSKNLSPFYLGPIIVNSTGNAEIHVEKFDKNQHDVCFDGLQYFLFTKIYNE